MPKNKQSEKQVIAKFVNELCAENYSQAHKYLQEVIDLKIKNKMAKYKKVKPF